MVGLALPKTARPLIEFRRRAVSIDMKVFLWRLGGEDFL